MDLIGDGLNAARINQIEQIPQVKIKDNDTHSSCSICISDFTKNEIILILPCVHKFHRTCIQTWLSKNNTCPTCRESVFEDLDPVWDSGDSSDDSVNVEADFSFSFDHSTNSLQLPDHLDMWDITIASDFGSESTGSDQSNAGSEPTIPPSPSDTLGMDTESGDSSTGAWDESSGVETDVMNESHVSVSSESENSEQSDDGSGIALPITSDESSDSDVMLYDSSDSSD